MDLATWVIVAVATGGVIVRPWRLPEWIWAVAGAALLVLTGLLPVRAAVAGAARGRDVYLFLTGMMLLAELARQHGVFDWVAAYAARHARGSARRLFLLVYLVGVVVTVFLSNDATAVVLTPAVAAVARAARAARALPYLLACAFVANAASFVLPISNPANLVIYGAHLPPLLVWVPLYGVPSLGAVLATYAMLRISQRRLLRHGLEADVAVPVLSVGGRVALGGIGAMTVASLGASAAGWAVGMPICAVGVGTAVAVVVATWESPGRVVRHVSWGVLPLVAGLFVLVEALDRTGVVGWIAGWLARVAAVSPGRAAWGAGGLVAAACNVMNNLPAGLIAGTAVQAAGAPALPTAAILIGVDLGPNLSVTGSLATILWLTALRREGVHVGTWNFLRLGAMVMPPALVLALLGLMV